MNLENNLNYDLLRLSEAIDLFSEFIDHSEDIPMSEKNVEDIPAEILNILKKPLQDVEAPPQINEVLSEGQVKKRKITPQNHIDTVKEPLKFVEIRQKPAETPVDEFNLLQTNRVSMRVEAQRKNSPQERHLNTSKQSSNILKRPFDSAFDGPISSLDNQISVHEEPRNLLENPTYAGLVSNARKLVLQSLYRGCTTQLRHTRNSEDYEKIYNFYKQFVINHMDENKLSTLKVNSAVRAILRGGQQSFGQETQKWLQDNPGYIKILKNWLHVSPEDKKFPYGEGCFWKFQMPKNNFLTEIEKPIRTEINKLVSEADKHLTVDILGRRA
jgi:hypothetical protein